MSKPQIPRRLIARALFGCLFVLVQSNGRPVFADDPPPQDYFTIPEVELLSNDFAASRWGAAVQQTDAYAANVMFAFSGLSASSTGLKDDYPVETVYGQAVPSHGNGDFSMFDGFALWVQNLDDDAVNVSLFVNTGFTGPSGVPSGKIENDTFWQSPWTLLAPGQARTLLLEFDNAIPWNINDNPSPHTQGADGTATSINDWDRTEISAIGFQVYADANPQAIILAAPAESPFCPTHPQGDLNRDCRVDFIDVAQLAMNWLEDWK